MAADSDKAVRFGDFELNLATGELWKSGVPVKLQPQPAKVLAMLVTRAGQLVTREEIREQVWKQETFVDFQQGVNFCIKQIRVALGDEAESPRFLETLPRRGYRFIGLVETGDGASKAALPALLGDHRHSARWLVAIAVIFLVAFVFFFLRRAFLARPQSGTGRITLAVLPLENLSADPDQAYLSDGLTEEMITDLGRLQPERLRVIARTSALQYRNTRKTVAQIGRELGANYILEGSVRKSGNRVRVSTQLIRVSDQSHVWAETYDRELQDVLALEEELARTVVREIRVQLTPGVAMRFARSNRPSAAAYEAYLKGRYHWRKLTPDNFEKAIDWFQKALAQDPNYAAAYAGLADSYYGLSNMRLPPQEAMTKARAAAQRAIALDDTLPEAHLSLAFVKAFYDWDWAAADHEFKAAIELDPSFAEARVWYGAFECLMGRLDPCSRELQVAQDLDPLSINASHTLALPMYLAGKYDQAIAQTRKGLELEPNFANAHSGLAVIYEAKGDPRAAISELEKARKLNDSPELLAYLGRAYAVAGDKAEANRIIAELTAISRHDYVSPFNMALVHTGLHENRKAIAYLERGYTERAEGMINLKTDPRLRDLRSDRRFQGLLRRMAFPD